MTGTAVFTYLSRNSILLRGLMSEWHLEQSAERLLLSFFRHNTDFWTKTNVYMFYILVEACEVY